MRRILDFIRRRNVTAGDRKRVRHFHGREKIAEDFLSELRITLHKDDWGSGTIFLIKGAPGSGKTALLHRFSDLAEAGGAEVGYRKWRVLQIRKKALYNPVALMNDAGIAHKLGEEREWGSRSDRDFTSRDGFYVQEILKRLAHRKPLLLVLDEVHTLGDDLVRHEKSPLGGVLNWIHNGHFKNPVMLACGGLGTSSLMFSRLGIERFTSDCLVTLKPLSEAEEQAVIRDWLVKDGGAQETDIHPWIAAITQETHGWPQHIMFYVQNAMKRLKARNGQMTPEDLEAVLKHGRVDKRTYYKKQIESLDDSGLEVLEPY